MDDLIYTILAALLWVAITFGGLLLVANQIGVTQ
jgi:hypothetical protein